MRDKFWMGGDTVDTSPEAASKYSTEFSFGCQFSETGLFRTKKADGTLSVDDFAGTRAATRVFLISPRPAFPTHSNGDV